MEFKLKTKLEDFLNEAAASKKVDFEDFPKFGKGTGGTGFSMKNADDGKDVDVMLNVMDAEDWDLGKGIVFQMMINGDYNLLFDEKELTKLIEVFNHGLVYLKKKD